MKKVVLILILLFINLHANALTFEEALFNKKPCAVLIYASWADDTDSTMASYDRIMNNYINKYNYLKIDIANPSAKQYNERFIFEKNLPYAVLYKDRGRFSRRINKDCILEDSCFKEKLDIFAN